MVLFEDILDVVRRKFSLMVIRVWVVRNSDDLEVRFGHREASIFDLEGVNVSRVFNVVVDDGNI